MINILIDTPTPEKRKFLAEIVANSIDLDDSMKEIKSKSSEKLKKEANKLLENKTSERQWQNFMIKNINSLFYNYDFIGEEKTVEDKIGNIISTNSRFDLLFKSQFGIPYIVELKKSTEKVLVWDSSHNKFMPSSALTKGLSQLQNYLRVISRNEKDAAVKLGIKAGFEPLATGVLIIGNSSTLFKEENYKKLKVKHGWSKKEVNQKAMVELSTISYNQKNIDVVTYDRYVKDMSK